MDEARKQALIAAGINVDEALSRMMGSEALLMRLLKKFLDDANYAKLLDAVARSDAETALTASHTLKGVCGNLSMAALFDLLTRQVGLLRAEDWAGAMELMPGIDGAYEETCRAIRETFG